MKKVIIPIFIILLVVLFSSCNNSVQNAVEENEERLVGFMNCYRTVHEYNYSQLMKTDGTWDLSTCVVDKNVADLICYMLYPEIEDDVKFIGTTSAKGTYSYKEAEETSGKTKKTLTFNEVEIKYKVDGNEEEKILTLDGVLSISNWDETEPTATSYISYYSPYFVHNEIAYKSMSAVIVYPAGGKRALESASYDGAPVNCDLLNRADFINK